MIDLARSSSPLCVREGAGRLVSASGRRPSQSLAKGHGGDDRKAPQHVERRTTQGQPQGIGQHHGVTARRDERFVLPSAVFLRDALVSASSVEVSPQVEFVRGVVAAILGHGARIAVRIAAYAARGRAVFAEVEFELVRRAPLHGSNHEASDVAEVRNLVGALRNV